MPPVVRASTSVAVLLLAIRSAGGADPATPGLRLPAGVAPVRYAVELWVDPAKETFRGKIEIQISLKSKTDVLWLNAKAIAIESASVRTGGAADAAAPVETSMAGDDFVRVHFQRSLLPGLSVLTLEYSGRVESTDTSGVFREREGPDWYLYTQFEALDARRAFPCFDEPGFKTPWHVTLHVPRGLVAVSNAPVTSETTAGDETTVVFAPTRPLPSYLVAFGVGPFDVVDAGRGGRKQTPIRILVPRGRTADARFAAATSAEILGRLEDYFGMAYPFEKLDELVVPVAVGFGAMENAGLVTYVARDILAKPDAETPAFRRTWARYGAHETAHQWFGDDVTMAWWNDLWLNEAFASWMEAKIVGAWRPEWHQASEDVLERDGAMEADALTSARHIRQPIETADDIDNAFDAITYDKGAAVIAMFESWLGEETFRKGVRAYLTAHSGGSASSDDFMDAIAKAAGDPGIAAAFRSFLDQPGVPLVHVALTCDAGAPLLSVAQKRALPVGSTGSAREIWRVPVCVRTGEPGAASSCTLLSASSGVIPLSGPCPARVLANARGGYYRLAYDAPLLRSLLADSGSHLSVGERIGALADVRALTESGELPLATALGLVPTFAADPDRHVVAIALDIADVPRGLLAPGAEARHRAFVRDTFGPRALAFGWMPRAGEDEDAQLLRAAIVPFVADRGEDSTLTSEAAALARAWLADRKAVDPQLVEAVLSVAARRGDEALFRAFRAEAKRTQDRQERRQLMTALGAFRDGALADEALLLVLSPDFESRESIRILRAEAAHSETRERAWSFLRAHYEEVVARLPRESPAALPLYFAGFDDARHRAEVEAFFRDRSPKLTGGPRLLSQALERIQLNAAYRAAQQGSLDEFLARYEAKPALALPAAR